MNSTCSWSSSVTAPIPRCEKVPAIEGQGPAGAQDTPTRSALFAFAAGPAVSIRSTRGRPLARTWSAVGVGGVAGDGQHLGPGFAQARGHLGQHRAGLVIAVVAVGNLGVDVDQHLADDPARG